MARPTADNSAQLEHTEGILGSLGQMLAIIEMDHMRVSRAIELTGTMRGLLEPVTTDMADISQRIRRIQRSLSTGGRS